jgi:hypothetical protein
MAPSCVATNQTGPLEENASIQSPSQHDPKWMTTVVVVPVVR